MQAGLGAMNAWCYKSASGATQITAPSPGVSEATAQCSGKPVGDTESYLDGTITCLSNDVGWNTDCSPINSVPINTTNGVTLTTLATESISLMGFNIPYWMLGAGGVVLVILMSKH